MKTMGTPQRTDDQIASYSSKGPTMVDHIVKPDLVAPGNLVVSLLASTAQMTTLYPQAQAPLSYYESTASTAFLTTYMTLSGATAVVSGAAAVLLTQHPGLSPDQVKARPRARTRLKRSRSLPTRRRCRSQRGRRRMARFRERARRFHGGEIDCPINLTCL
jgi:subtilisin family serine protease